MRLNNKLRYAFECKLFFTTFLRQKDFVENKKKKTQFVEKLQNEKNRLKVLNILTNH